MAGAPTKFTQELFDDICEMVSNSERGLVYICKDKGIKTNTFYDWIAKDVELMNKYARAKELQAEYMAEQILNIADQSENDDLIDEESGNVRQNSEWINRSRLRVDARKWLASKLLPKKFGDKVQQEVSIASDGIAQLLIKPASDKNNA